MAAQQRSRWCGVRLLALLLSITSLCLPALADNKSPTILSGTITAIDLAKSQLELHTDAGSHTLVVDAVVDQKKLLTAKVGDSAEVVADDSSNPQHVSSIQKLSRPIPGDARAVAFASAFLLCLVVTTLFTGGNPQSLVIGADNRYSNSQTQMAIWFSVVALSYVAMIILRVHYLGFDYLDGVGLTENTIVVTGLSAFTFGGAKTITQQKIDAAISTGQAVTKSTAAKANIFRDLIQNDAGRNDLGDFQMVIVTLAAVAMFIVKSVHASATLEITQSISLPDVDNTLLSTFGIGQGAYLVKKAASKLGEG